MLFIPRDQHVLVAVTTHTYSRDRGRSINRSSKCPRMLLVCSDILDGFTNVTSARRIKSNKYYIRTLKKIFGTVLLKRFINIRKYTLLEITS